MSGDSLGNYRLALSVELAEEEGDRLVHQLAGLDIVESPDRAKTPRLWEEGTEPGPEYEDNQDLQCSCPRGFLQHRIDVNAWSPRPANHKDKKERVKERES